MMTVRELIEKLGEYPENYPVYLGCESLEKEDLKARNGGTPNARLQMSDTKNCDKVDFCSFYERTIYP